MISTDELARVFDSLNPARLTSPTLEHLWSEAYGSSYADVVKPNGFYPKAVVQRLEHSLAQAAVKDLADLGCGAGSAGLWLSKQLGLKVVGVDISSKSIAAAEESARRLELNARASFKTGDVTSTGIPDASFDAVICLDVLLYVADKAAALGEVRRILRPGGIFGFTTWEQDGFSERLGTAQVADHRPLLDAYGFDVELFEEPHDWRTHQEALLRGFVQRGNDLVAELGESSGTFLKTMGQKALEEISSRRYVFCVCRVRP